MSNPLTFRNVSWIASLRLAMTGFFGVLRKKTALLHEKSKCGGPACARKMADMTNEFTPYVVMTEAIMEKVFNENASRYEIFEQVKKMTTNYRVWGVVTDYIRNAGYLITDRIDRLKERA